MPHHVTNSKLVEYQRVEEAALESLALGSAAKEAGLYLKFQLPEAVGLPLHAIRLLLELGCFPLPRCRDGWGWAWNRKKIDAWRWGLLHSPRHAANVEAVLGWRLAEWTA